MSESGKQRASLPLALAIGAMLIGWSGARAADMPDYYDPPPPGTFVPAPRPTPPLHARWDGIYFGGQYGRAFTTADFGNSSSSQISYILANTELESVISSWTNLPSGTTGKTTYGGFVGFNTHWEDVVGSLEFNYNQVGSFLASSGSVGPIIVPGATQPNGDTVSYTVTVDSSASIAIKDVLTARGRVGWAFDRFLPYAFGGLAIARADVARTTSVTGTKTTTTTLGVSSTGPLLLPRSPQSESRSLIAYGFTAGLGVDVDLLANVFLRAEWEYTGFANIDDVRVNLNAVHAGIGVRF